MKTPFLLNYMLGQTIGRIITTKTNVIITSGVPTLIQSLNFSFPGIITMVLAGVPIGVIKATDPPTAIAMTTALGSMPNPVAIEIPIGASIPTDAVLDINWVSIAVRINKDPSMITELVSFPSNVTALLATNSPAPVYTMASANVIIPNIKNIVSQLILL